MCTAILELTVAEYESVRASSRHFIVLAGHEIPDTEVVVDHVAGYALVEKLPESASLVDAADPRRDQHWSGLTPPRRAPAAPRVGRG